MDRTELQERASHYRELAARVTDEQARAGLLDLAGQYEALAKEVAAGTADRFADTCKNGKIAPVPGND